MLEKDIEGRVVDWAKDRGFLTPKVRFVENGYPDRLFISPSGHTIFIEFKKPGKKPEPIQNFRLQQLRQRNIPAYWCDTYESALFILKAAVDTEELPDKSDKAPIVTSIRRAISGSGAGENVNNLGSNPDPESQRVDQSSSDRGPAESSDSDVASGD